MLKFQIFFIAVLIACFAFVSCERAQQIMTPATDDMMSGSDSDEMKEDSDTTGDTGMTDGDMDGDMDSDMDGTDGDMDGTDGDMDGMDGDMGDMDGTDAGADTGGTDAGDATLEVVTDADGTDAGDTGESTEEDSTEQ